MKKVTGSVLTIGGLAFLVYTGINYLNNSGSFSLPGTDVMISRGGNIVPVIISAVVLLLGVVLIPKK